MTPDTKFVFFGTPEFAAIILERLIGAGFSPVAVVCNPDKPVGRKKIVTPPPVKRLMANGKLQIEILQPASTSELLALSHKLSAIKPDFAIVAAYAKIIPKNIIDLFPRGVIGVHPSLLPKYRGATPIQSAILGGETETGTTLFMLDEKMDRGGVVSSVGCQVSSEETYEVLLKKLAELSGNLLTKTLPKFIVGEIRPQPQDEMLATYTKKFSTDDAFVAPEMLDAALLGDAPSANEINRKIRALNPEPGVWTFYPDDGLHENCLEMLKNKRVKLLDSAVEDGKLTLKKIQYEGKKAQVLKVF